MSNCCLSTLVKKW